MYLENTPAAGILCRLRCSLCFMFGFPIALFSSLCIMGPVIHHALEVTISTALHVQVSQHSVLRGPRAHLSSSRTSSDTAQRLLTSQLHLLINQLSSILLAGFGLCFIFLSMLCFSLPVAPWRIQG
jgi:hypothetical protein